MATEERMDVKTPPDVVSPQVADSNDLSHDPISVTLLRQVLDNAWALLPETGRQTETKFEMASRILASAAKGERDPVRLRTAALVRVVT